jgi:PQ loop repeat protein
MLTATEIAGFAGAGLAGAAYVPQISHLVRARCSAGISRLAFEVWLLASLLITARAIAIHAGVFIALGGIQIAATAVIVFCATRYKDTPCPHPSAWPAPRPGQPRGRAPWEPSLPPGARPAGCCISRTRRARQGTARIRPGLHPHGDPVTARSDQGAGCPGRAQLTEVTDGRCGALRRRCQTGQEGPCTDFQATYLKETI